MKRTIAGLLTALILALPSMAADIQRVSDSELEEISAQGFSINFQTMDSVINSGNTFNITTHLPSTLNMVDSLMISGASQQNAFVPVNAVNSAVNVPINIVIVMDSMISGGINISNVLDATTNLP
ncbi:hypothetical protein [Nitrosophilus alvini]|uniref:hypothetical protein n=1 Tax=Nitrosophilus alvini TaxID=2714855 RepID=UPI00190B1D78|nr:hypothetical protein [Nitrosophilus alvini]